MVKKIIFLTLFCAQLHAGIYKWTDENGNVHFGDRPASTDNATELDVQTDNSAGITNSSGNTKEREYLLKSIEKEKAADAKKQKKQAEKNKKYKKLCRRYQSRLQIHLQTNKTYTMSPDGERAYYTQQQREEKLRRIQKGVKKYCR